MQLHTPSIYSAAGGLDDPTGIGGLALDDPHTSPDAGVNGGGTGAGGGGVADRWVSHSRLNRWTKI
jgi:hypothetical protein